MGGNRKLPITWSTPLLQKMAILALIITLLPTAMINMPSTSAQPDSVYLVKYVVHTTSDWTDVMLDGLSSFASNASIVLGADAPQLWYQAGPGEIHIVKKLADATPVTLEALFLTLRGSDNGSISIESGAMGETVVDVS